MKKYTGYGIIRDMQGNYNVVPVKSYYNIASAHKHLRYVSCWTNDCPSILFDLLVGVNVFADRNDADYAYYIWYEVK